MDLAIAAPLATRLLLGATVPGRMIQAAAIGAYAGSALADWIERAGARKIDFLEEFGADVHHLDAMTDEVRRDEAEWLAARLNDGYTPLEMSRDEMAVAADRHLTAFIAGVTGQRIETSTEIRSFTLAKLVFPFALGTCDIVSGDVAILQDAGLFEPHVIAHEFSHRKGYLKELEAQALAYMALAGSGEPALEQSAHCERLHRNLRVLSGDSAERYHELVDEMSLREELSREFHALWPETASTQSQVRSFMKTLIDERMKLTGQNGLSDYDLGFTNFLFTFEKSSSAARRPAHVVPARGTASVGSDPA
jgi:hypothetical protein